MKVYHGTAEAHLASIMKVGLWPRGEEEHGNWSHENMESSPEAVYLTTAYGGYFANAAAEDGDRWVLVEIDTDLLDEFNLHPDEDFMEQASRGLGPDKLPQDWPEDFVDWTMKERTHYFRDRIWLFQKFWKDSLEGLGTCQYREHVPVEAFTKVVAYDPGSNMELTLLVLDPSITLLNFRILGGTKYRALTRWLAGYEVTAEEVVGLTWEVTEQKHRDAYTELLARRDGLEVLLDTNGRTQP